MYLDAVAGNEEGEAADKIKTRISAHRTMTSYLAQLIFAILCLGRAHARARALNHALPTRACARARTRAHARTSDTHTSHTRLPHTTQRCLSRLALAIGGPKSRAFLLPSCVRFGPRARSPQRSALSRIKFILIQFWENVAFFLYFFIIM